MTDSDLHHNTLQAVFDALRDTHDKIFAELAAASAGAGKEIIDDEKSHLERARLQGRLRQVFDAQLMIVALQVRGAGARIRKLGADTDGQ